MILLCGILQYYGICKPAILTELTEVAIRMTSCTSLQLFEEWPKRDGGTGLLSSISSPTLFKSEILVSLFIFVDRYSSAKSSPKVFCRTFRILCTRRYGFKKIRVCAYFHLIVLSILPGPINHWKSFWRIKISNK